MDTKEYCLYSPSRGYLVKMMGRGPHEWHESERNGFNNVFEFNENVVIFIGYSQANHSRGFLSTFGAFDDIPVPDLEVKVHINGMIFDPILPPEK